MWCVVVSASCLLASACAHASQEALDSRPTQVSSYLGPNAHTMVVIRGSTFTMGSPLTEPGRSNVEIPHRVRIPRVYAIATTEVTNEQFAAFLSAVPEYGERWKRATTARFGDPPGFLQYSRTPDSPQVGVSWFDTARYCNWLSEAAGIPRNQWVYPESIDASQGLEMAPNYLHRTGYRLPTEAEWENAARAGTVSSWYFGEDVRSLPEYGWYDANTKKARMHPVARRRPNQWGLFDMAGNAWEWTLDRRQPYPSAIPILQDAEDSVLRVSRDVARTRRGGSFAYEWFTLRSAHRGDTTYFPNQTRDGVGFRVARTMPPDAPE